jgi:AcrR family transcriptional regulator
LSKPSYNLTERKTDVAEAILDAAERLLSPYGYQKMTMNDLAAEAGIGVGTTYLHFSSKADVAVAVVKRFQGRMYDELRDLATSSVAADARLAEMFWRHIAVPYGFVRAKLTKISWQQLNRYGTEFIDDVRNSDPAGFAEWKNRRAGIFAQVIAEGVDAHIFFDVPPIETAFVLLDAVSGFLPKNLEQLDFQNPDDFEKRVRRVIRYLMNAILVERNL